MNDKWTLQRTWEQTYEMTMNISGKCLNMKFNWTDYPIIADINYIRSWFFRKFTYFYIKIFHYHGCTEILLYLRLSFQNFQELLKQIMLIKLLCVLFTYLIEIFSIFFYIYLHNKYNSSSFKWIKAILISTKPVLILINVKRL